MGEVVGCINCCLGVVIGVIRRDGGGDGVEVLIDWGLG